MTRLLNFLGKIVGLLFFIGGSFMGIYGTTHRNDNNPWFMIVLAFIIATLGLLMVFARPSKPNSDGN